MGARPQARSPLTAPIPTVWAAATYILGTINNNNNFQLNAGGGSNSVLTIDSANVTLQGGGTVTMSNSGGGGGAIIYQAVGGETLTNVNNTIQGTGIIGFNGLTVVNEATINANVSGQTLTLESMTGGLTNTGMLEASNGGTLYIDGVTVNNAGGGTYYGQRRQHSAVASAAPLSRAAR